MTVAFRFTSADLDRFPEIEGVRYEIIDGELYVSRAPGFGHQVTCLAIGAALHDWSIETGLGTAGAAPGLVFADDQDVIPDVVWVSAARRRDVLDEKGHFCLAPELVVEVLSPGRTNEVRDREVKLSLYSRRDVQEYWIVDWPRHLIDLYRRHSGELRLIATLSDGDELTSPLLPGFTCQVSSLWPPGDVPTDE